LLTYADHFGATSKSLHSVHAVPYGARLSFLVISMTRCPCCFGPFLSHRKQKTYDSSLVNLFYVQPLFVESSGHRTSCALQLSKLLDVTLQLISLVDVSHIAGLAPGLQK
jgi:hypothetical protein